MITAFSILAGMTIVKYKNAQISYIDDIVFLAERIMLFLKNTAPDTEVIISKLQNEQRLAKYEIDKIENYSPLNNEETERIGELFTIIGKYDADTQIKYLEEYAAYFKELERQYKDSFTKNKGLYMAFSVCSGVIISLMII